MLVEPNTNFGLHFIPMFYFIFLVIAFFVEYLKIYKPMMDWQ